MAANYPNNPNIFVPPEVTDGFETLPLKIAEGIREGFLDAHLKDHSEENEKLYARTIVGSEALGSFYAGLRQSYKYHAMIQGNRERQPVAVVYGSRAATLGLCVNRTPGDYPKELSVVRADDTFRLRMVIGWNGDTLYELPDPQEGDSPIPMEIPSYKTHSTALEATRWHAAENGVTVTRERYCEAVAIGRSAVEALPQFARMANAYDQLLSSSTQAARA